MNDIVYNASTGTYRYTVEFFTFGEWTKSRDPHRTLDAAKSSADAFWRIGTPARVIDNAAPDLEPNA